MENNHDESLTIACISLIGGTALLNCISSVLRSGHSCMVIAGEEAIIDEVNELVSDYHLEVIISDECSVPAKRAAAVKHATTNWIALIEDTCILSDTWKAGCKEIMTCDSAYGASGPVALGRSLSTSAQALYCSDYARFLPSSARRHSKKMFRSETLPGVNLLYRRETIMQYINSEGLIESEANRQLTEAGLGLYIHEDLAVILKNSDKKGANIRSRFIHGRLYGGLRSRNLSPAQRVKYGLGCALLPFVRSFRSLRSLVAVHQHIIETSLLIILYETAWSCGEFTGYLSGCGRSLEHWK